MGCLPSTYRPFARSVSSLAVAVLALGLAAPAAAGTLSIKYQITGGGFILPPGAAINGGMYTVEFDASGSFTIIPGPAILKSFSFSGTDSYMTYGDTFSTAFNLLLNGEPAGNGTVAGGFSNVEPVLFSGTLGLHCSGGTCGYAGFVPSVTQFYSLLVSAPTVGFTINAAGANLTGTYSIVGVGSDRVSIFFTGQEVSRTFVPEPDQHWMGLVALASIAGLRIWSRGARTAQRR